jgi:uncharacterized membrane protein
MERKIMPNLKASLLRAVGMGAVAGMRSMTAPAVLSHYAEQYQNPPLKNTPLEALGTPEASNLLKVAALGEMVADKLPFTPDRTQLPSVAFRALSGATVGLACTESEDGYQSYGAVAGAVAAVAATYGMHRLRKDAGEATGLPNLALGLLEDAMAVSIGIVALRSLR